MRGKKAIINIISSLFLQGITIICGFIVPRLIIQTYGSNVNGLIASITQFLAFITLLEAGFGPVVKSLLYKPIALKNKNEIARILRASEKLFRIISYIFLVYILALCLALPVFINNEFSAVFTMSLIVIIAISTFSEYFFGMTFRLYLQAEQKTYVVSIIQVSTIILNTIAVFALIKLGASIQIVKLATSLIFVLRPVLQNVYVKKKYNISFKNVDDNYLIKQKWNGLAQHIAYIINSNTDIAILTLCGNLTEVSVYAVYVLIIDGLKNIVKALNSGIDAAFGDMIAKGENDCLNKNFNKYELLYFIISTVVFSSTIFLIVPFVKLYTQGITDVNYIRPMFAYLMILGRFLYVIRQPYSDLVKVSGHFKQTQVGAWVEAVSNIVISIALVWKFGIIGVAIGTLVAMIIRTIDFMRYASKNILHRSIWISLKNLAVAIGSILIISIIMNFVFNFEVYSYGTWMLNAVYVGLVSMIVVVLTNLLVNLKSFKLLINRRKVNGE